MEHPPVTIDMWLLNKMAEEAFGRHANIRIGKLNYCADVSIGLYIGPNFVEGAKTKREMYFYLLGVKKGKSA